MCEERVIRAFHTLRVADPAWAGRRFLDFAGFVEFTAIICLGAHPVARVYDVRALIAGARIMCDLEITSTGSTILLCPLDDLGVQIVSFGMRQPDIHAQARRDQERLLDGAPGTSQRATGPGDENLFAAQIAETFSHPLDISQTLARVILVVRHGDNGYVSPFGIFSNQILALPICADLVFQRTNTQPAGVAAHDLGRVFDGLAGGFRRFEPHRFRLQELCVTAQLCGRTLEALPCAH